MTTAADIARGLTNTQREALQRLAEQYVRIDGRSLRALVGRGLATVQESGDDALIGAYAVVKITPLGLEVRAILQAEEPAS